MGSQSLSIWGSSIDEWIVVYRRRFGLCSLFGTLNLSPSDHSIYVIVFELAHDHVAVPVSVK